MLDPDQQIQGTLRTFFETFRRTGSAMATLKAFRAQQLLFPRRARHGPHTGEVLWAPLEHSGALRILRNPRYAGAFFFGRTRQRRHAELGHISTVTQLTVELTLAIHAELEARAAETDRLRRQHVERAQYEAELARRRYLRVDPIIGSSLGNSKPSGTRRCVR
jgi:hypothetical protein